MRLPSGHVHDSQHGMRVFWRRNIVDICGMLATIPWYDPLSRANSDIGGRTGHQKVPTEEGIKVLHTSDASGVTQIEVNHCFKCENRFGRSVCEFPFQLVL